MREGHTLFLLAPAGACLDKLRPKVLDTAPGDCAEAVLAEDRAQMHFQGILVTLDSLWSQSARFQTPEPVVGELAEARRLAGRTR